MAHYRDASRTGVMGWLAPIFSSRARLLGSMVLVATALAVVAPGLIEWLVAGEVAMHWSRAAFSSLLLVLAAMLGVTTFLLNMLDLIRANRENVPRLRPPDRTHPARATG